MICFDSWVVATGIQTHTMTEVLIGYYLFILAAVIFTFSLLVRFVRAHEEIAAQLARVARKMENLPDQKPPP